VEIDDLSSDNFGLGDATLFSRYEIYRKDGRGSTTRLAPLIGVRVPTGKTGETSDGSTEVMAPQIFSAGLSRQLQPRNII